MWQFIATTVSACDIVQRTLEEVREKWGGLKKKFVSEQARLAKTGGGPAGPSNPHGDLIAYILGKDTELIEGVNGK